MKWIKDWERNRRTREGWTARNGGPPSLTWRRKAIGEEGVLEALTEMTTCGHGWKPPQWRGPQ